MSSQKLQQKLSNQEDMALRLNEHIIRWESAICRLESSRVNASKALQENRISLGKAQGFREALTSQRSVDWYSRFTKIVNKNPNDESVIETKAKLAEYDKKLKSVTERIERLNKWISEGESNLKEIETKISDINVKIQSARSKIG